MFFSPISSDWLDITYSFNSNESTLSKHPNLPTTTRRRILVRSASSLMKQCQSDIVTSIFRLLGTHLDPVNVLRVRLLRRNASIVRWEDTCYFAYHMHTVSLLTFCIIYYQRLTVSLHFLSYLVSSLLDGQILKIQTKQRSFTLPRSLHVNLLFIVKTWRCTSRVKRILPVFRPKTPMHLNPNVMMYRRFLWRFQLSLVPQATAA
jgi:hypothetical protein